MTMFDELIDLLDLVGSRDCIHADWAFAADLWACGDDACEPCTARGLHRRMTAAKARVSPQDDAVRTR